jgi:tRNA-Thr(GGU) m(6)t(6)A37 methyltransferase TsaA
MSVDIVYRPIGILHTPFRDLAGMPIQPTGEASAPGTAQIFPSFADGLKDLEGFSHIILLYHLHQVQRTDLRVVPFLDSEAHGVFATRSPTRPNPIGLSVVRLLAIQDNVLHLANVDILDGTPLLDIKPYVPAFDRPKRARAGWLEVVQREVRTRRADDRFRADDG